MKENYLNKDAKHLAECTKCGKIADKMHMAPAFVTVCPECYIKEHPHIDVL